MSSAKASGYAQRGCSPAPEKSSLCLTDYVEAEGWGQWALQTAHLFSLSYRCFDK